jgi:hypothetical protein
MAKVETTPVIFRKDKFGITAIFPHEPANDLWCYCFTGHSEGSLEWYYKLTKPATPAEYAALKRDIERLTFDGEPVHPNLRVISRLSGESNYIRYRRGRGE